MNTNLKQVPLKLRERITETFSLGLELKISEDLNCRFEDYIRPLPDHFFSGVYKLGDMTVFAKFDRKLIYALTNRYCGGAGVIDNQTDRIFTDSELITGSLVLQWIEDFLQKMDPKAHFIQRKVKKSTFSPVLMDDAVTIYRSECFLGETSLGVFDIGVTTT